MPRRAHWIAIGLGLSAAVGVVAAWSGQPAPAAWTAAVATLCAFWWVTEAIPIPATSLVPMAVLPTVGVLTGKQVGEAYGSPLILLLLGGFLLSAAMERSGAHRRLAVAMVRACAAGSQSRGVSGRRLVIGFMLASSVLSMWVSNSATTLMLLPIALAALERSGDRRLTVAVLLGIAYAASIGGVTTPIGTPPNLLCLQELAPLVGEEPTFATWIGWAGPVSAAMLPIAAWWLTRGLPATADITLPKLDAWRPAEVRTLAVFAVTALLWVTRREPLGGWSDCLGLPGATDAGVALLAVLTLFVLPSGDPVEAGGEPRVGADRLLDWESAVRIPWGILLLFSGGMVLAKGFTESGLDASVGAALGGLGSAPPWLLVTGMCLAVTFLTEVTSNTAVTALLMPVLATTSAATGLDPRLLMVPAAASASFAFMLPVATAPNAAVYGAGVPVREMTRRGFALNLFGAAVISAIFVWRFG
ncbi:MAG: DASS family sodium-coupled anion symporter [Planctomycetota bacterium]